MEPQLCYCSEYREGELDGPFVQVECVWSRVADRSTSILWGHTGFGSQSERIVEEFAGGSSAPFFPQGLTLEV